MEMRAEAKENIWQAARTGNAAAVRRTLGVVNTAVTTRPAQPGEQLPLRIMLCQQPCASQVRSLPAGYGCLAPFALFRDARHSGEP